MKKPKVVALRHTGVATHTLPVPMEREIGRIVIKWAFAECYVQDIIYGLMNISPEYGRLAVREPRLSERLELAFEILKLRGATWDDETYKLCVSKAEAIKSKRDLYAHGMWCGKGNKQWFVRLTRGKWPKATSELVDGLKSVILESVPVTIDDLKATTNEISILIDDLCKLRLSAGQPKT